MVRRKSLDVRTKDEEKEKAVKEKEKEKSEVEREKEKKDREAEREKEKKEREADWEMREKERKERERKERDEEREREREREREEAARREHDLREAKREKDAAIQRELEQQAELARKREEEQMRSKKESGEDIKQKELQKTKEQIETIQKDFKKRGHFDTIKKQVYAHFCGSDAVEELQKRLTEHTDSELNRDPSLRVRDRGKAAVLIERSAIQKGVYQIVEDKFKELLESRRTEIEAYMKELMVAQGILDPSDDLPSFDDDGRDEKEEGDEDVDMENGSAEEKVNGNEIPEKKEAVGTKREEIKVKREEPADIEMTDRALVESH